MKQNKRVNSYYSPQKQKHLKKLQLVKKTLTEKPLKLEKKVTD